MGPHCPQAPSPRIQPAVRHLQGRGGRRASATSSRGGDLEVAPLARDGLQTQARLGMAPDAARRETRAELFTYSEWDGFHLESSWRRNLLERARSLRQRRTAGIFKIAARHSEPQTSTTVTTCDVQPYSRSWPRDPLRESPAPAPSRGARPGAVDAGDLPPFFSLERTRPTLRPYPESR